MIRLLAGVEAAPAILCIIRPTMFFLMSERISRSMGFTSFSFRYGYILLETAQMIRF